VDVVGKAKVNIAIPRLQAKRTTSSMTSSVLFCWVAGSTLEKRPVELPRVIEKLLLLQQQRELFGLTHELRLAPLARRGNRFTMLRVRFG
jgi:hypothetical protein